MVFKIFNVKDIDKSIVSQYLPLLTQQKRMKILSLDDALQASRALAAEMLARQCLCELCNAPESSFQLLINPDSKSAVTNFDAKICVCTCDEFVACSASSNNVGISVVKPNTFSFSEMQQNLSDSEVRYILSSSKQSLTDVIRAGYCDDISAERKYASLLSLKKALFNSSGKVIMKNLSKINFNFTENAIISENMQFTVKLCEFYDDKNIACSIVERNIL